MKTIVITGATSFLGVNTIKELLKDDCIIYALVRPESSNVNRICKNERLKICYGTLGNIADALKEVKNADAFIHFAWDGSGDVGRNAEDVQMKNVEYAMNALKIASQLNCSKFVFPGSQAEYGIKHGLITENMDLSPVSPYGKAKHCFATKAREYCLNHTIQFIHLRIFSVYGYGDRFGTLTDSCMRAFIKRESVSLGACLQQWNYLYINDFAKIMKGLIDTDCSTGIYNVASDDTRQLRNFVEEIYQVAGKNGTYDFANQVNKPEGVPDLNPDITKLKELLPNFHFTSFHDGVLQTLEQLEKE